MKSWFLPILMVALSSTAIAQTDCSSVPKASDRLACYDKANPPSPEGKLTRSEKPSRQAVEQPKDMGDALLRENARLDATIKNICRGC
jgi:hypothetical protein